MQNILRVEASFGGVANKLATTVILILPLEDELVESHELVKGVSTTEPMPGVWGFHGEDGLISKAIINRDWGDSGGEGAEVVKAIEAVIGILILEGNILTTG